MGKSKGIDIYKSFKIFQFQLKGKLFLYVKKQLRLSPEN